MSAAAPSYRFPVRRELIEKPFSWRQLMPSRTRGFVQILRQQSEILRRAARLTAASELEFLCGEAAALHTTACGRLRSSLFTPFDAEDLSNVLNGVVRVVRSRHRLAVRSGAGAIEMDRIAGEWALCLAELIPQLPKRSQVDARSAQLRAFDARFRQEIRRARGQADEAGSDVRALLARQVEQGRWQTLRAELRWLSECLLRVRYRNG